ncbi:hypothetical protein ARAM_005409 [Aspergillus rambellii]|uniref:Uncharacterized protein n=1 Tax=Aspergillus rambellii TaxID=308745 RepID=A0A0F8X7Z8_9EURO|nr:hypothetical protein ARAM_005409 [Aspergillus rambellii]
MGSYSTSSCRGATSRNGASSSSTDSDTSGRSKSTVPTIYSDRPTSKRQERMNLYDEEDDDEDDDYDDDGGEDGDDLRDSTSTLGSSDPSSEEAEETPQYEVMDRKRDRFRADAIPSNSSTFAKLFPSCRRLLIRHDDATLDGNMNLRVDTMVPHRAGYQQDVILFHLRMYDLFTRKFSFRRYSRDSGREVCHSQRRPVLSNFDKHPIFQSSWSSVLASLRPGSNGHGSLSGPLHKRPGSGYKAVKGQAEFFADGVLGDKGAIYRPTALAESIVLEFSNYAHVELKRRGTGMTKRYEYEYWATKYQWRREWRKEGDLRGFSYHLVNMRTSKQVAHIVPEILTPVEAVEEESKGGWIPPSSMWISDPSAYKNMHDVAE